jgi:prepilin-type N-terminal cleavage/methylation domain-containing protein
MRKGFTLAEVMIASSVMVIALTAIVSAFITTHRMLKTAMVDAELSLSARELREKLLFHASPSVNGIHYAGLLSGTNAGSVVESSGAISMSADAVGSSLDSIEAQAMRILLSSETVTGEDGTEETRYFLFNDGTPNKNNYKRWLWPGYMTLCEEDISDVVSNCYDSAVLNSSGPYALCFNIELKANVKNLDGSQTTHRERVYVPLFRRIQPE